MINEQDDDSGKEENDFSGGVEEKKNIEDGIVTAVDNHDDSNKEIRDIVDGIIGSISQVMVESIKVEQLGNRSSNTLGMRVKDSLILKVQQSQKKATPFSSQLMCKLQQISCSDEENMRFLSSPAVISESESLSTRRKKSVSLADEVEVFNRLENEFFFKNEAGIVSRNERRESEVKSGNFLSENNEVDCETESDAGLESKKKKVLDVEVEGDDILSYDENFFGNSVSSILDLKTDREEGFQPSERRLTSLNSSTYFESSVEMLEKNFTPFLSNENIEYRRNSETRINSEDFFTRISNFGEEIEVDHNLSIESFLEEVESKLSLKEMKTEKSSTPKIKVHQEFERKLAADETFGIIDDYTNEEKIISELLSKVKYSVENLDDRTESLTEIMTEDKSEISSTEIEEKIQQFKSDAIRDKEMKEAEEVFNIPSVESYKNLGENNSTIFSPNAVAAMLDSIMLAFGSNSEDGISGIVVNSDLNLNDDKSENDDSVNLKEILKDELEKGSKNSVELVEEDEGSLFNKNVGRFSEDRDDRGVFKLLNKNFTTAIFKGESLVKFATASLEQKDSDCGKNDTWKYSATGSREPGEFEGLEGNDLDKENTNFNNFDEHFNTEEEKPVDGNETSENETLTPESGETDTKKRSSFFSGIVNSKKSDKNSFLKEEIDEQIKENSLGKFADLILNVVTIVPSDDGSSDPTGGDPCCEKTLAKVSRSRKKLLNDVTSESEKGCSKLVESFSNSVISSLITDSNNRDIRTFLVIANEEIGSSNEDKTVGIIENKNSCSMLDKNKEIKSFEVSEKKNVAAFVALKNIDGEIRERRKTESAKNFANSLSRIFSNSSRKRNLDKGSSSCLNSEKVIRVPFKSSDDSSSARTTVNGDFNGEIVEENGEELVAVKSLESLNNDDRKVTEKRSIYPRSDEKSSDKRRKVSSGKSFAGIRKFFSKVSMRSGQGTEEETGPEIKNQEIRRGEDGKERSKAEVSTRVLDDDLKKSSGACCVVMNKVRRNNEQQVTIHQLESSEVRSADRGNIDFDKDEKNLTHDSTTPSIQETMQSRTGRRKSVGETESSFSRRLKRLFKKRGSGSESIASKFETSSVLSKNCVADIIETRITDGSSLKDEGSGVHDVVTFYTRHSNQNDNENHLESRNSKSTIPLLGTDLIKKRSNDLTKAFLESRIRSTTSEENLIESSSAAVPTSSIRNTFSTAFPQDFEFPFGRRRSVIVMMATPDPPRREIQPEASSTSNHQQSDAASR